MPKSSQCHDVFAIAFSGIASQEKVNYDLADKRTRQGNLQYVDDKIYIGRGLEVENCE